MSLRSGLAAQLGVATETTFGTRNVPDHFYELVSESMKLNKSRTAAKGIRPGKVVQRSQRFRTTKIDVSGDVNLEVASNTFGLLFYHSLGTKASIADGAGFKRTYTLGDTFGLSMTVQIGTPDVGGTVRVREYTGCKVDNWELSTAMDQVLNMKLGLDGINESTSQTLAIPSWASNTTNEVYYCDEVTLTVGGTPVKCKDFTLTGKNSIKTDRYYIGQDTKGEQIRNAYVDLTGQITPEFNDLTLYNMFVNDTVGTSSAIVITATGQKLYDTSKPNKIVITLPAVRYDGTTPNVAGPDVIDNPMPFTLLDDDTNQPIQVDYYTSDAND